MRGQDPRWLGNRPDSQVSIRWVTSNARRSADLVFFITGNVEAYPISSNTEGVAVDAAGSARLSLGHLQVLLAPARPLSFSQ